MWNSVYSVLSVTVIEKKQQQKNKSKNIVCVCVIRQMAVKGSKTETLQMA